MPQISFDPQPLGQVPGDMERADVCGPMTPNGINAVVRMKLVRQPASEIVGLADIDRTERVSADISAEDVNTGLGEVRSSKRMKLKLVSCAADPPPVDGDERFINKIR